ncbi:MAG: phosphoglycerate kinase [Desulfobulbus propionicus]|nr:MAG: phosphoglycerate kinase [Desulfobulbus propionicus]
MKKIEDLSLAGKKVFVRVDFNVPMADGRVQDDLRMQKALQTITFLRQQGARTILCTHLGRPTREQKDKFSLAPVAEHLSSLIGTPVVLAPDCIGPEVEALVQRMQDRDVLMLENIRLYKEETENDRQFAAQLAGLAEVYVNDAFAVSHRAHASVVGVPACIAEKAPGFLLQRELDYFQRSLDNPVRPLVAIVGGAKVSGKLQALENMLDRVDGLILGGAMANTFLKSQGYALGDSLVEDDLLAAAADLLRRAADKGVKVYLPVDVVAAERFANQAVSKLVTVQDIPDAWMALDIGPASVLYFNEALAKAKTIVWNGPMGAFEMDSFSRGTMAIAHTVAASHALTVIGGGDSNAAIKKAGEADNISYMSTGGGAFLRLMEGKALPGVQALA